MSATPDPVLRVALPVPLPRDFDYRPPAGQIADAGIVTNQPSHTSPKVGVGAGLRYNSPVGPLQLDLAYGVDAKRFRVHLNVGFSF